MPSVACPVPGCDHATDYVGDATAAVLIKYHLDSEHAAAPNSAVAMPTPKIHIDRPRIKAGARTDDWAHFNSYLLRVTTGSEIIILTQNIQNTDHLQTIIS